MGRRAALLLLALGACGAPAAPPQAPPPPPFVAMSFNVRYGTADDGPDAWPLRRERLAATLAAAAPTILGVQEALAFQLDFLQERLPHHRRCGQGRDGGHEGEHAALFVDARRFAVLAAGDFWLSPTPETPASIGWDAALTRICSWALLREHATGRQLRVWNTHLDHRGALARQRSAELIAARIQAEDGPWLLLGDFNAGEDSAPLAAVRAIGLRDTFRDVAPQAAEAGTFHAFRGGRTGEKIDYVLASAGLTTVTAAILDAPAADGRWPSDHHPVMAALVFRLP